MKFKGPDIVHFFGDWDKFDNMDAFMKYTYSWIDGCDRILKPGKMFISYFDRDKINFISYYLQNKGYKIKGYVADCKSNPVPQARRVKWMNGWEIIGLWRKSGGKLTYNYQLGQHKDYFIRPIVGGKERTKHPTQKPLSVIKDFVLWWSNENDIILDPFFGSGTTGVVCLMNNRNFIGIESNLDYYNLAVKRLNEVKRGLF